MIMASVMAAMAMVAIEATIVSTAMPLIVGQLGGLSLYAWVFSSFLLTQTAATVVFGKLSDLFGRRPVLLFGIAVFVVGSVLAGFSWSMPSMIAFRLIQGAGAGAIQPVGMTVVGDLYSARERGRIQGYLASVWAVSAVVGPLAGGLIVRHLSWAWVFWINVPVGLVAGLGFILFLREDVAREKRAVDWAGAALFTVAVASLMVGLTAAGDSRMGDALWAGAVVAVSGVLFFLRERRAREPMVALDLWGRRPVAATNAASLLAGMALIGLTSFLPMYVQGVLGRSALVAGFALTVMVLGWPVGATLAARGLTRFGLRPTMVAGGLLMPVGALVFPLLGPASSPVLAGVGSAVMGFGMGLLSTASLVLVQEIVDWSQRGSATASNIFSRNLGSTLGATALGLVLNLGLARAPGGVTADGIRRLLDTGTGPAAVPDEAVRAALDAGLHLTFWAVLAISVLTVLVALFVPAVAIRAAPAVAVAE